MSASFGVNLIGGTSAQGAGSGSVADTNWASQGTISWPGGNAIFAVVATAFNAATVQLQVLGPDGITWMNAGAGLAANGIQQIFLAACAVRCVPGAATGVFASLSRVVE